MSAHTPKPWLHDSGGNYSNIVVAVNSKGKPKTVARIASGEKTREADARLISSAPDMLEALELYVAWSDAETKDFASVPFGKRMAMCAALDEAARAAIAKAKGKT